MAKSLTRWGWHRVKMGREALACAVLLLTPLAAGSSSGQDAPNPWHLISSREGVDVWQRSSKTSAFVEFSSKSVIAAPIDDVAAVIWDANRHCEWMPGCIEEFLLDRLPDGTGIVYGHAAGFFPFQDRDVVFATQPRRNAANGSIRFAFHDVTDTRKQPRNGIVRIPHVAGFYDLRVLDGARTEVTYQVMVDPGGLLPAWLVNWGSRAVPEKTQLGLRSQVARGGYQTAVAQLRRVLGARPEMVGTDTQGQPP